MKCIICNSQMSFYFSKHFALYELEDVEYWVCPSCGFAASKTHFDMNDEQWADLNSSFHKTHNNRLDNPFNRFQRYFNQALMLHLMKRYDVIHEGEWLDWGCGLGNLSIQLAEHFNIHLLNYDKFVKPEINSIREEELTRRGYNLVVSTAVFEHLRSRDTFDEIESYVSDNQCLAVHTLVRGEIPKDPSWMYLLPVHCSFHTNRSMQILMDNWGYHCSVYNEQAKLWIMFKQSPDCVSEKVSKLNTALGWEYLHYSQGFMDYWP